MIFPGMVEPNKNNGDNPFESFQLTVELVHGEIDNTHQKTKMKNSDCVETLRNQQRHHSNRSYLNQMGF